MRGRVSSVASALRGPLNCAAPRRPRICCIGPKAARRLHRIASRRIVAGRVDGRGGVGEGDGDNGSRARVNRGRAAPSSAPRRPRICCIGPKAAHQLHRIASRRIGAGRVDGRGVVGEVGGDNGADDAANVGSLRQFDMRRRIVCSLLPAGLIGPPKEVGPGCNALRGVRLSHVVEHRQVLVAKLRRRSCNCSPH